MRSSVEQTFIAVCGFRSRASRRRPRRGATILLVTLTLTLLLAMAGLAVDFARMYVYKAQLKTLADAAALSMATDLKRGETEFAALDRVSKIAASNRVDGSAVAITPVDIQAGRWTSGDSIEYRPWSLANAVQVTVRYPAEFTLGRLVGVTSQLLTERSIAVVSGYISTACAAPIAIPDRAVSRALGRQDVGERLVLTEADLERLVRSGGVALPENMDDAAGQLTSTQFSLVTWRDANRTPRSVTEVLEDALEGCQVGQPLRVGDTVMRAEGPGGAVANPWLEPSQRSPDPLAELCGDPDVSGGAPRAYYACGQATRLQVPIVRYLDGQGAESRYRVEYIGALSLYKLYLPNFGRDASPARISGGTLHVDRYGGGIEFEPRFPGPALGAALVR
jgi:Flp pilus assembly protein TadG